jgi:predicted nucleic acid-binding protein
LDYRKNNIEIIISNTTPIITFLIIERLDLLRKIYTKIYIPRGVYEEIENGIEKDAYINLQNQDWIEIKEVENKLALQQLENYLDRREAEAIILYQELKANLLMIDEKLGRSYAKKQHCNYIGSFGVLLRAKELDLIDEVKPLLLQAKQKGIFISESLFYTKGYHG